NHTNAPMTAWDFATIWITNAGAYPTFVAVDDGDGISAAVEEAAPNSGDANNDGTPDDFEANVASFVDPVTGHYVSLQVSNSCDTTAASSASEATKPAQDSGYSYPAGLLSFTANCGTNGFTASISQYYYGLSASVANLVARKYNAATHGYN